MNLNKVLLEQSSLQVALKYTNQSSFKWLPKQLN